METSQTFAWSRWAAPIAGVALLAAHATLLRESALTNRDATQTLLVNSAIWFVAAMSATLLCALTALQKREPQRARERQAWWWFTAACGSWALGQIGWTIAQFVPSWAFEYPGPNDFLFFGYVPFGIAGLLRLPKPQATSIFSIRHSCNLVLLFCALLTILMIALYEPGRTSALPSAQVLVHASYCLSIGCVLIVALYLMWSYRWHSTWVPLVLIALGAGIYTFNDIFYLRLLVAREYRFDHWINLSWTLTFVLTACAANEQRWRNARGEPVSAASVLSRERWLEATMPGLLLLVVSAVGVANVEWLSMTVLGACTASLVLFAVVLAIREYAIQKGEQRLLAALNASHGELERRVAERTFELDRAYRELEGFSYAVAHDIKAPLRAMNGFGALLEQEYAPHLDEKGAGYIGRIRRGAVTLAQLVDDLLAYTRVERIELESRSTNIASLLADCVLGCKEEAARAGAEIALRVEPFVLDVDPQALTQSVRNLLQNAIKFSRTANPPKISIESDRVSGVDRDLVRIRVTDNGIGFDMQYHEKIFALFQRLHRAEEYAGTGIGLAIARKAVERMHGRLWAESSLGNGATFFIELPCTRPKQ